MFRLNAPVVIRAIVCSFTCHTFAIHHGYNFGLLLVCVFRITKHLGSGQFGTVNKGIWQSPAGAVEVAVKILKLGSDENDRVKFLQEAAINGQFRHPNIVKLLGVITVGEPVSKGLGYILFLVYMTLV